MKPTQTSVPCILMRGGSSRGPYFKASDLPSDRDVRDRVLLRVMGSPDARQIDGIGGATSITSKVAIYSQSVHPKADVDYLFAQVSVDKAMVDTAPTCGNMLSGIGPLAIEENLVQIGAPETQLWVRNVNTNSLIHVTVQTPNGRVTYDGDTAIAGVPGTGSPIKLQFFEIVGSKTSGLLPTGNVVDVIDGVEVSCFDVATPMVIVQATALGKSGYETKADLDSDTAFWVRVESLRRKAALKMGMGDVRESVLPKMAIVAPPQGRGDYASRYFVPDNCHPTYAVSGSICVSACAAMPGTVANAVTRVGSDFPAIVRLEHPEGIMEVTLDVRTGPGEFQVISGGIIRTARRLFAGNVYIPHDVWDGVI